MTPSGRFETNTKVCLSFSAFHPELWQPAWGIRLILEALIAFLPSPADGAIGSLDWTSAERKKLAKKSVGLCCHRCGKVADLLPELEEKEEEDGAEEGETKPKKSTTRFEKEIEQLRLAQLTNEKNNAPAKKETEALTEKTEPTTEKTEEASSSESAPKPVVEDVKAEVSAEANAPVLVEEEEKPKLAPTPAAPTPTAPVDDTSVQEAETEEEVTPEHVVPQNAENPYELDIGWLTDPMLNVAIVLLAAICFLLARKSAALLDELQTLNGKISV